MTVIDEIREMFSLYGQKHYGEACNQTQHAISAALHAKEESASTAMIIAAFLHDIGHFIADKCEIAGFDEYGHQDHADIGANWLKERGFPAGVYQPIRYHVMAKRYAAGEGNTQLSHASAFTLAQQGGLLSTEETDAFQKAPYFEEALQLRRYDDSGKPTGEFTDDIAPWLKLIDDYLSETMQTHVTVSSYSSIP